MIGLVFGPQKEINNLSESADTNISFRDTPRALPIGAQPFAGFN